MPATEPVKKPRNDSSMVTHRWYHSEPSEVPSVIVDATALEHPEGKLRILRHGVIPDQAIIEIVGAERCA